MTRFEFAVHLFKEYHQNHQSYPDVIRAHPVFGAHLRREGHLTLANDNWYLVGRLIIEDTEVHSCRWEASK